MAKLVILGLGAAGFSAILAAKKTDSSIDVTVIDDKDYDLMHPCGLPFSIEGKVKLNDLKHDLSMMKINKVKGTATKLDPKSRKVFVGDKEVSYDKLIIATGSSPFIPPIEGKENAYVVHNPIDADKILKAAKKNKKAIVVGAGPIGLELAIALKNIGLEVTVIEMKDHVYPAALDKDMAKVVEDYVVKKGIKLELGTKMDQIKKGDFVVFAAGVRANLDLIKDTAIKIDNCIIVNEKMQTSVKNIYAVGDIVEVNNILTRQSGLFQLATMAYKQGQIAGINAAGGNSTYKGSLGTFASVIDDIEIAATGLTESAAKESGFDVIASRFKGACKPNWCPGSAELTVKLVVDKRTHKLLGCQAVGKKASNRVDIAATAIQANMDLEDFADLELAYNPMISEVKDVLIQAAELCLRRLG